MNTPKQGDRVTALGKTYTIDRILYAEYWDRYGWDIEFIDQRGGYHHWKQAEDGGQLMRTVPRNWTVGNGDGGVYYDNQGHKCLLDDYGTDVTDLFRKYGQPV